MDISPFMVWVVALSQLLSLGMAVYTLLQSRSKKNEERLEAQAAQIALHDQRLGRVEHTIKDIPSQRDFHELETKMERLSGALQVMAERMRPLEAISERLQEWLLAQGKH